MLGSQQPFPGGQSPFGNNPGQGGNPGNPVGAPQLRITQDLLPIERAQAVQQQVVWQEGEMVQIYCVSTPPVQEMRFTCPDCNTTGLVPQYYDQLLGQHTQNLNDIAGFPAIKLARLPMNGEMFDRKTLRCEAFYPGGPQGRMNVSNDVLMNIMYLSNPRITDQFGHNAIATTSGNRFYVPQQGMTLHCLALGNPSPTAYQWFINGVGVAQQASLPVTQQMNNNAITCKATNSQGQQQQQGGQQMSSNMMWKESPVVMLGSLRKKFYYLIFFGSCKISTS